MAFVSYDSDSEVDDSVVRSISTETASTSKSITKIRKSSNISTDNPIKKPKLLSASIALSSTKYPSFLKNSPAFKTQATLSHEEQSLSVALDDSRVAASGFKKGEADINLPIENTSKSKKNTSIPPKHLVTPSLLLNQSKNQNLKQKIEPKNINKLLSSEKDLKKTIKDREKNKRMKGQSSHATWKSETFMKLRQNFDS